MSVTGGRRPWAWAGSRASWLWLPLLAVGACGGRTSALERDAFDPNENPFIENPSGGSSSGGSSSAPTAGVTSMPVAGSTSAGGSSGTDASTTVCQNYCSGYAVKCPQRLEGRDCISACVAEMTSFGPKCQKAGHKALKCLAPVFKKPELSCEVAVDQALTKCSKQVTAFDKCKNGGTDPQPDPEPEPPEPVPTSCTDMSTATLDYCYHGYSCPDGLYVSTCSQIPGNAAYNCSCSYPNGMAQGFTIGSMAPPCDQAAKVCGFNPAILQ